MNKHLRESLNSGQVLKNQKLIKWLIHGNKFPVKKRVEPCEEEAGHRFQ